MSKQLAVIAVLSIASFSHSAEAASGRGESTFWKEVRKLVNRCAIQPVVVRENGRQVIEALESTCSEIQVFDEGAELVLNGKKYFAYIRDSKFADYGDLNDVEVQDMHGSLVARRNNIPAFGDVLLALAGGDAEVNVPKMQVRE